MKAVSMKSSDRVLLGVELFSKGLCDDLIEYINVLPKARWTHRTQLRSIPTAGTDVCDYWFLGDAQQPKEFNEFLISIAPIVDGFKPKETIVNRYEPGGGMSEHIDMAPYRTNMLVMLSNNDDGVEVDKEFYKDDPGKAVIFPFKSPPHRVPPVKQQRFVLIYLYE